MSLLNLLTMSCVGGGMVLVVLILRTIFLHKLPKEALLGLWYLAALRLLCPLSLAAPVGGVGDVGAYLAERAPEIIRNPDPVLPSAGVVGDVAPLTVTETAAIPWTTLWLVGVCLFALAFLLPYLRCRWEFRTALPVENGFTRQWRMEHCLHRTIAIRQWDRITAPLSYGVLRPVILLPKTMDWADTSALDYVFCHELVHIRRFDALGKLVLAACLCLHWFNPLVWLFYILANRDMELACDAAVIRSFGAERRGDYARTLIRMEESKSGLRPLTNHFSKSTMEERILAIMKTRKITALSLTLSLILAAGIAVCGFTVAVQDKDGEIHLTDYGNDMESSALYAADDTALISERLEQWEENLKPYSVYGITCRYDAESDSVRLYCEGREVRGLFDAQRQIYFTEHTGYTSYSDQAIDLYAVYENGRLTGLREGTPEEKAQEDQNRKETTYSPYAPFGLRYHAKEDTLYFQGKRVRYFTDSVDMGNGGSASRRDFFDREGVVDVYTVREAEKNIDGSINPFGPLKAVRAFSQREFESRDLSVLDGSLSQEVTAVYSGDEIVEGVPFAEEFAPYRRFGLTFEEEGQSGRGNVYLHGELVRTFVDKKPTGGVFSFQSKDGGGFDVETRYDGNGNLLGIEKVK